MTKSDSACSFTGCDRAHYAKTLCNSHYMQDRQGRTLTPIAFKTPKSWTIQQKLYHFSKPTPTGCVEWTGGKSDRGYGSIHVGGKGHAAHRVSYEISVEAIPEGMVINHKCRNTSCINPTHLEAVTQSENTQCRETALGPLRGAYAVTGGSGFKAAASKGGKEYVFGYFTTRAQAAAAAEAGRESLGFHDPVIIDESKEVRE